MADDPTIAKLLTQARVWGSAVCDSALDTGDHDSEAPEMVSLNLFSSEFADGERCLIEAIEALPAETRETLAMSDEELLDTLSDAWFLAYDSRFAERRPKQ
ncbi:MAG: hypothetical protein JKY56_03240 [Kofleriaceae bacterium]|nr:hypothetical protein [Kofleriaceae bacterium]